MIRIDIVDDHKMVINGLTDMLKPLKGMQLGASYETGAALLVGLQREQPNILLMDIELTDVRGDELAKLVSKTYPLVKIIALTGYNLVEYATLMMDAGASGYLLKNTDEHKLSTAIETVFNGGQYIEPVIREKLSQLKARALEASPLGIKPTLTRREKDILDMILKEMTSQEMAQELKLGLRTIENHRVSLMQKLDAKNSAGIVKRAFQLGLV